jgi:hypothetical protein
MYRRKNCGAMRPREQKKLHITMGFTLRRRSAANCTRYSFAFSLFLFAGQSWQSSLFHQLLLLDLEVRPA